jgi:hypothetical protein
MRKLEGVGSIAAVVAVAGLGSFCALAQVGCGLPTKGLVAHYPLDGSAIDRSGLGNHGTVTGPVPTANRRGQPGRAYAFDGLDDYIEVPDSPSLRLTGPITMSAWFRTTGALPFAGIICKAEPTEPRHGYLLDVDDHRRARADVVFDHSTAIAAALTSTRALTDGVWHHVLAVYDGQDLRLYVDGRLDGKAAYDRGMQVNSEPLLIGWDENTWLSHRHFRGSIDDIRIYGRALRAREAHALFKEK